MKRILLLLAISLPSAAETIIYQYLDENGRHVFTDRPPQSTGLVDRQIRKDNAARKALLCSDLADLLANKRLERSKLKNNVSREFYLDSQIRLITDEIAASCENVVARSGGLIRD